MRTSWYIWLGATVLLALYTWAGSVASKTDMIGLTLEPGYSTQVHLFRFAQDHLRMRLIFQGSHARRLEMGDYGTRSDWRATGLLKFDHPGSAIRIVASMHATAPIAYEALPKSGSSSFDVTRTLTPGTSVSPGVWRWPPTSKGLALHPGASSVDIRVDAVEQPLIGERVELWVEPALDFKTAMPNIGWLWPSLLWPLFAIVLVLWAVVLWVIGRRRSKTQISETLV